MNRRSIAGALLSIVIAAAAYAGPPIMCNPLEIAKAKSLPMGDGAFECDKGYNAKNLVADTIKLLDDQPSPIVRMESLRRATVYAGEHTDRRDDLARRLAYRALDASCAPDKEQAAAALFDAGFLATCCGEMGYELEGNPGEQDKIAGYGWLMGALAKLPSDSAQRPEIEFGIAVAGHPAMHGRNSPNVQTRYDAHIRSAAKAAQPGSLLEQNLKIHLIRWGSSLEAERAKAGADAEKTKTAEKPKK